MPIEISADVTPTNLSNLAIALNKVSAETGVTAVTPADNTRIILTSDAGDDIAISNWVAQVQHFLDALLMMMVSLRHLQLVLLAFLEHSKPVCRPQAWLQMCWLRMQMCRQLRRQRLWR